MIKHTLSVCKFCYCSSGKTSEEDQQTYGTRLFEQLNTLAKEKFPLTQLEIQPVGCMWACSHGCVVAVSSPEKPTYFIVDLPPDESAAELLEFMQLYISNDKGAIAFKKLRELFSSATFVQIPPQN